MTGFLHWLYRALRVIVRLTLRIVFPVVTFEHRERLAARGPFIVTGNHPNTLSDVFLAVAWLREQVFFLANASLFRNPVVGKTLNTLYCIPVQRPKDVDGGKIDNKQAFARSYAHLQRGGNIYIAPEGGSDLERKLRPLKTGAARIALGAEEDADWALGLRIIPIGVNYEHPLRFLGRVLIRVGEPIEVAAWRSAYENDPVRAAKQLTQEIFDRMRDLLIHTEHKVEERLLTRLERSLQNDRPLHVTAHHYRTRQLLADLRELEQRDPAAYAELQRATDRYRQLLRQHDLDDLALSQHPRARFRPGYLLGLPIFLYGWINHWIALYLPYFSERWADFYRGYRLTVYMVVGLISVPLAYVLQTWLVSQLLPVGVAWLYLFTLPLAGLFAHWYARWARPFWTQLRYRWFDAAQPEAEQARRDMLAQLPA